MDTQTKSALLILLALTAIVLGNVFVSLAHTLLGP